MRLLLIALIAALTVATVVAGRPAPGTHAQATQVLVLDEDAIDNGSAAIEALAATLAPPMDDPSLLVNDDIASYTLSQALPILPGTPLTLPSGQAGDEGFFSLPLLPPFSLADYLNGVVPQSALDPVAGVSPMLETELLALSLAGGSVCAVVYDSDVSINYDPLAANLQGARLGVLAFTVTSVGPDPDGEGSVLPLVTIQVADAAAECGPLGWVPVNDTDRDGDDDSTDVDDDSDLDTDAGDNCDAHSNGDQTDGDGDGAGDACDADDDNDGQPDGGDSNDDNDAVDDASDDCPTVPDPLQPDDDLDGAGDACDADDDQDGAADIEDPDDDNDGVEDLHDTDDDDDGIEDVEDPDDDSDGVDDSSDPDDDNDSVDDADEHDLDLDGIADDGDADDDSDSQPDVTDSDDDNDAVDDTSDDCDTTPDPGQADTDGDSVGDACDSDDDDDLIDDADEGPYGTAPADEDTDDDACGDGSEILHALDPLDGLDFPDANTSMRVDFDDFLLLVAAYGATPAIAGWDARVDFDGTIEITWDDLLILAAGYGNDCL